ncbi:hypothetical protein [Streptomyces aculeolatus]|uniref:hypothetical protein n=1 Tax=Streptomyces aculeolatus TaxID=270689 RepID=UPI001CECDAEE|nr:hypothetical protein [Streptomyces aculeolatus]
MPLGDQKPALAVDGYDPFLCATLNHQGCRPSGWYEIRSLLAGAHLSWTSRFFTLPMDEGNDHSPRPVFIVCPYLDAVNLDQDGGDGRSVITERHWRAGHSSVKNSLAVLVRVMEQTVRDGMIALNPPRSWAGSRDT